MTATFADRVRETTTTVGTGAIQLGGAVTNFRAFSSVFTTGTIVYYCITDNLSSWEVGYGTLTSGVPWTLSRDTILSSSIGGGIVTFGAGTKDVFSTFPAHEALNSISTNSLFAGLPKLAGLKNRADVNVSWSNATRTLSVSPVGASFQFYADGILYTKTATETVTIPNTTGNYYFHYDATGTLSAGTAFDDNYILVYTFLASIYWNATTTLAVPDCMFEMHGADMPAKTHLYLHHVSSTAYDQFIGGLLPTVSVDGTGNVLTDIQFSATPGAIWDDDVQEIITAKLLSDNIPILYRTGALGIWTFDETSSAMVRVTGTGRAAYNQFTGGSWQLTEVTNNNYLLMHLFAIPGITKRWMLVMGQHEYATIALASDAAATEITTITGNPLAEHKDIATFIIQTSNLYTNAFKSRVVSLNTGDQFFDWRFSELGIAGSGGGGSGNVTGPIGAGDNNIAVFNGTSGTLIKDGGVPISGLATVNGNAANVFSVAAAAADDHAMNRGTSDGRYTGKTSGTGSAVLPAGTTAQRDVSPGYGYLRYNSDLGQFEGYNTSGWGKVGGGATGGGTDSIFMENDAVATQNYTVGQSSFMPGVTITIATPAVFTFANHGFIAGSQVTFATTGALPTGLSIDTVYFVKSTGLTISTFEVSLIDGGTSVATSGTQSGVHSVSKVKNASVAGPLTIASGVTITVPTGSVLTVI